MTRYNLGDRTRVRMTLPATPRSACLAEQAAAGAVDYWPQPLHDSLRMETKCCRAWRMVPRLVLWPVASVHEEAAHSSGFSGAGVQARSDSHLRSEFAG